MLSFKEFLSEAKESTTEWMPINKLSDHIHGSAVKAMAKHDFYKTLLNHDMAHGGSGELFHRVKTNKHGMVAVQAASNKKDKEGHTHHATFHVSASGRRIIHGEWEKNQRWYHTHSSPLWIRRLKYF